MPVVQAKLAQKAEKQQETQERLMRSLYSTPQDRMTVYQDIETLEEQRKAVQEADRCGCCNLNRRHMYASHTVWKSAFYIMSTMCSRCLDGKARSMQVCIMRRVTGFL